MWGGAGSRWAQTSERFRALHVRGYLSIVREEEAPDGRFR